MAAVGNQIHPFCMNPPFHVLLYYKYVLIEDPETFTAAHLEFCRQLGLKGRVIIAQEGMNGTLAGPVEATDRYRRWCAEHPLFADMPFKIDDAEAVPFKRLSV